MDNKLFSKFLKAIKEYDMIQDGDRIAIGVSGGKDSILLYNLFSQLKKTNIYDFSFVGITLDPGFKEGSMERLQTYMDTVPGEYHQYPTNIWQVVFDERTEKNPCSLCGKMRRGILYSKAEELGCNKLALGHHQDDIVETLLMNMFYSGTIKTMLPKVASTTGKFDVIRPLTNIYEDEIIEFVKNEGIKPLPCGCRIFTVREDSKRLETKIMLKNLQKKNPHIKKSIFNSMKNINLDYVLGYTNEKK